MDAIDILKNEHRAIEIVLNTMEKAANALDAGKDVDPALIEECVDFVAGFADRCHHLKEEQLLFPLLQQRGITREGGPIGHALHDHDEGRKLVKSIRDNIGKWRAGSTDARKDLSESLRHYATFLENHIVKEDDLLFKAASKVLTPEDNERLKREFDEIEEKKIGRGVHEEYHTMLEELKKRTEEL